MKFAVAVRKVQNRFAVSSPFVRPTSALVQRQPLQLANGLGLLVYVGYVHRRRNIGPQERQVFSISRGLRPWFPVRTARHSCCLSSRLSALLIHSYPPY